ncbi:enoyl-CoA hydratase/isomerase family protein [Tritonibacter multivorans]|nr:enoyl-CoA hydratase/isomerase family protein [Tritonibacter multivorans]
MQAPRANALAPEILAALHSAFDALETSGIQKALITGGRHFSTGGDVARFYDAAHSGHAEDYSDKVVPPLQSLVLRMIEMPVLFATAVRGAATGGSAGLLFASHLAVAAPDAFVQPYYGTVGFAPDGGWTALLPDLVGRAVARSWLMANQRKMAEELHRLGLIQDIAAAPEDRAQDLLDGIDVASALATKSLFWNAVRREAIKSGLSAEAKAFRQLIGRGRTQSLMQTFLENIG